MPDILYTFEARKIQNYILLGNKLKEMTGGSEIVNSVCNDFLDDCLNPNFAKSVWSLIKSMGYYPQTP